MIKNRATRAIVTLLAAAALFGLASCDEGTAAPKTYAVTVATLTGGAVTAAPVAAAEGETITLVVTPDAGQKLTAGALVATDGAAVLTLTGHGPAYTFTMPAGAVGVAAAFSAAVSPALPLDFEDGISDYITSNPGYLNTMPAYSFSAYADAAQTDTGYKVYTIGAADGDNVVGDWNGAGLVLGAKDLAFEYGADADGAHIVLSLKSLDFGSFSGKTGLEFTLKLPSIPAAGAFGLMPHIRYNSDGAHENAVVFAREIWAWPLADDAFFTVKIPFTAFTKPGYSDANAYTTIADAIAASVAFNQLDFDLRFVDGTSGVADGTKYTGFIDNIQLY